MKLTPEMIFDISQISTTLSEQEVVALALSFVALMLQSNLKGEGSLFFVGEDLKGDVKLQRYS